MKNQHKFTFLSILIICLVLSGLIFMNGCKSESNPGDSGTDSGPVVNIVPEELYFGQIPTGQFATRSFLIFNTGEATLNISKFSISGTNADAFKIIGDTTDLTIAPNKIESFMMEYNPLTAGELSALLTVESNAASSPDTEDLLGIATSTAGNITFERIIGSIQSDAAAHVRQLNDGGFILAGTSQEPVDEANLATLTRLDLYGNVVWSEQYPVAGISNISGFVVTANENFTFTGTTSSSQQSNSDIFALSTDNSGNVLWENIYDVGGSQPDNGYAIAKTTQGGYIIGGATKNVEDPQIGGVKDAILIKIDNSGTIEWIKKYGTLEGEDIKSVQQTKSGDYICVGSTTVPSSEVGGDFDFYLLKTDNDGNQIWAKTYGGDRYDFGSSLIIDKQGDYVFAGYTASFGAGARDYWLIKTDTSGTEQWNKTFGGPENDSASEIIQTSDDGYFVMGTSASFTTNEQGVPTNQIWGIKTDNSGSQVWQALYGGKGADNGSSVREITAGVGGYIISGSTSSFGNNNDIYVLKTNSDGSI
jgi:hypothetical protein